MTSPFFPSIRIWHVPEDVLTNSLLELAQDGQLGTEGVALWLGLREGGDATITHLVVLRGPGVVKARDLLRIEEWLLNDVADLAIDLEVSLIGQIHSHGGSWVDLSPTDRTDGITVPYYLSVIAPHFGLHSETRVLDCGVHVFGPTNGWRRLSNSEVSTRVHVTPHGTTPLLVVGKE